MSGHEGASFCLHISPSAFASRTQPGGTISGPARLLREDQNMVGRSTHRAGPVALVATAGLAITSEPHYNMHHLMTILVQEVSCEPL